MKREKSFNKLKKMFHYGHFERRIIITFIEYFLSVNRDDVSSHHQTRRN